MTRTFLEILPFALGGAVSPVLLTAMTLFLATPGRGRRNGLSFFLGTVVVSAAFTVAMYFLLRRINLTHPSKAMAHRDAIVDVVLGSLLVVWAVVRVIVGPRPPKAKDPAAGQTVGFLAAFLSGLALMATNFSTLPLYAVGIRDVGTSRLPATEQVILLVVLSMIILIPAWLPLVVVLVMPKQSATLLAAMRTWLSNHTWLIITVLLTGFGFYLIIKGAPNLWS